MNGFTRKKVKSLTLGEKLRKFRRERRITLSEASRNAKIQKKYLEYLEDGNYDMLPPQVYVKGFLRSYANFLGVNENYLIKAYEREVSIKDNINKDDKEEEKKPVKISSFILTPKTITISAAVVLFLAVAGYFYKEVDSFISTPLLVVNNPSDGAAVEGRQVAFSGVTDKDNRIFINDQPALVSDEGEFSENISLQNGLNVISVKAVNRFDKESVKTISVYANYPEAKENDNGRNGNAEENMGDAGNVSEGMEVEIYVQDESVWVSVDVDGDLVYSGTLVPKVSQKFSVEKEISITSAKANNTFVKINGKDIGILGEEDGTIRDVTFTTDSNY